MTNEANQDKYNIIRDSVKCLDLSYDYSRPWIKYQPNF